MPPLTRSRFGLFAIIESKRVILPLKGVECDFSVVSGIVEVSIMQIFKQDNEKPLDCEYLFPLPADASVFSCEADINGRKIRAQVRERQEARRIAAEKKAEGFRTALVESERENLFTLSLTNVQLERDSLRQSDRQSDRQSGERRLLQPYGRLWLVIGYQPCRKDEGESPRCRRERRLKAS